MLSYYFFVLFFNDTATTVIYTDLHTLSLHDALPILRMTLGVAGGLALLLFAIPAPHHLNAQGVVWLPDQAHIRAGTSGFVTRVAVPEGTIVAPGELLVETTDRKSTRLNSSH